MDFLLLFVGAGLASLSAVGWAIAGSGSAFAWLTALAALCSLLAAGAQRRARRSPRPLTGRRDAS